MSENVRRTTRPELFTEWLAEHAPRTELVCRVTQAFDRLGPALPRRLRRELRLLIDEQSLRTLAECIALNERPEEDDAFADGCHENRRTSPDPYVRHGVRRKDFL